MDSLKNPAVISAELGFGFIWPECMTNHKTFFGHTRFDDRYYHKENAAVKCIKKSLDELAGERGHIESLVSIPLPKTSRAWIPTPREVSGHEFMEPIILEHSPNPAKKTVIWMFDLQEEAPAVAS